MDEEDVVHIYNGILLSHKKDWNNVICSNMDERRDCHAEWSKSDRDGAILYAILYMWNLKGNDANELIIEKATHRLREWTYGCQGEGIVREFGMDMYTLLYLEWGTFRDLLRCTWYCAQCFLAAWMGEKFERGWIHVYVWLSPFTVHLKLPQHCSGHTTIQNLKVYKK